MIRKFDDSGAAGSSGVWEVADYAGDAEWHVRAERFQFVMELLGKDSAAWQTGKYREVQHHDMSRIPAGTVVFS